MQAICRTIKIYLLILGVWGSVADTTKMITTIPLMIFAAFLMSRNCILKHFLFCVYYFDTESVAKATFKETVKNTMFKILIIIVILLLSVYYFHSLDQIK